jgi:mannose-1-phosphate guanylyltransferase
MLDIVILCGGSGTRLFPLSRKKTPKQFLNLVDENKSMFQMTLERANKIDNRGHLYIVCNMEHFHLVVEQVRNIKDYTIITEPIGRNTAPAICIIGQLCKSDYFLVLSSDHIWDDTVFCKSVKEAQNINSETIVVFGIHPTHPETGYGYLYHEGNQLKKFVEKPCLEKAQEFLKHGNYLWNSGNFLFHTQYIQKEFKTHCPDIVKQAEIVLSHSLFTDNIVHLDKEEFSQIRDESIDYAIMEHQKNCSVVPYKGNWSDIGSFSSLFDISDKDENNNVFDGDNIISFQSSGNLVKTTTKKIICLSNVDKLTVVETDDVLYIGDLEESQNVKKIVEKLKERNIIGIL